MRQSKRAAFEKRILEVLKQHAGAEGMDAREIAGYMEKGPWWSSTHGRVSAHLRLLQLDQLVERRWSDEPWGAPTRTSPPKKGSGLRALYRATNTTES